MPAAVRVPSTLPVLKATFVPSGRKRGNLSLSSQASMCLSIASLASLLTSSFLWRASQSRSISIAVVLPRPNSLLRSGKAEVSRRKVFEWILVFG